ncbi:MAG: hypothetical protein GY937_25255 [bacterium]|nr:hypothetical protein [bacterium]
MSGHRFEVLIEIPNSYGNPEEGHTEDIEGYLQGWSIKGDLGEYDVRNCKYVGEE